MASSFKPLTMTFTEDDLRVPNRVIRTPIKRPESTDSKNSTREIKPATPVAITRNLSSPFLEEGKPQIPRYSSAERRKHVDEILAEEDRLWRQRQYEKSLEAREQKLRDQLEMLNLQKKDQRTSTIRRNSPHYEKEKDSRKNLIKFKPNYKRYSDSRYYDWTIVGKKKDKAEHSCELCRLGLAHERREREKKRIEREENLKMNHCKTIDAFLDDYDDDSYHKTHDSDDDHYEE